MFQPQERAITTGMRRNGRVPHRPNPQGLAKARTGINGLDEITGGGLPRGRPTLVCGGPGCGKTLFALQFIISGATRFGEPGVVMTFEETEEDLTQNVRSLGVNLPDLVARKKVALDYVRIERSEIAETGEYDLEGLFIRLGHAIDTIGARRVVLDTIEALFAGLPSQATLRAELRRLFAWLKAKKVTAIITGERGEGTLTRYGLEEYVADCVILLDHRVINQVSTRRLRILKYRGSLHGTNEYPFLIAKDGLSVLPITSLELEHPASMQRVSTGVPRLDAMLEGKGYYRGSSVLISGTAGTGKTTLAAAFLAAACQRGERCLYLPFEESPAQIIRNMRSIGLDLGGCAAKGLLQFHAVRPTIFGLEMHLIAIEELVRQFKPRIIAVDPLTNLIAVGTSEEVRAMLSRLIDFFKSNQVTALFTALTPGESAPEQTELGISSLMDTWILLRNLEASGERNRGLYVLKARGMAHSNQVREFLMSKKGIELLDVYVGQGRVLTGAARLAQEAEERAEALAHQQDVGRLRRTIQRKRRATAAQIVALRAALEDELDELQQSISTQDLRSANERRERKQMARQRSADLDGQLPANDRTSASEITR